jgi:hypothetical protein
MSVVAQPDARETSRFAQTLVDLLDRVRYRRVPHNDEIDPIYKLRYEAYRREDFVPSNVLSTVRDEFDELPNGNSFGIYIDGQLASSIRLHIVTPAQRSSPNMSMWPNELNALLDKGHSFIDPGRFTADLDFSLRFPALPYLTLRIAAMACEHYPVRYCLSAVRPEHAPFYRRIFGSRPFAEERRREGLAFAVQLWLAEVPVIRDRVAVRFPFFMSTPEERAALFDHPAGEIVAVAPSARQAQRLAELQRVG